MDPLLVAILRCPRTRQALRRATAGELDAARARGITLDDALVTSDGKFTYPSAGGILCLLASGAIEAGNSDDGGGAARIKESVGSFYDRIGWQSSDDGTFEDATLYEDLRPVARDYIHDCHLRLNRHLVRPGRFLLDVASGPVQYPEYVTYADGFQTRVCVDLSRVALTAARKKLGERAVYILGDITNLPFSDGSFDGVVSLHTIYHVPSEEQARAFLELGRVLSPGKSGVVVYSWGTNAAIPRVVALLGLPVHLARRALDKLRGGAVGDGLYFQPQSPDWFASQPWPFRHRTYVWRSLGVAVMRALIHGAPGRAFLRSLYAAEERWPELLGRIGQYPLIVIDKPVS